MVLTDAPVATTWSAFRDWATPGYLESKMGPGLVKFDHAYEANFLYFNQRHEWADRARLNDIEPGARLGPGKVGVSFGLSLSFVGATAGSHSILKHCGGRGKGGWSRRPRSR